MPFGLACWLGAVRDHPWIIPRHRELLADLFERVVGVYADTETHAQQALAYGSDHT